MFVGHATHRYQRLCGFENEVSQLPQIYLRNPVAGLSSLAYYKQIGSFNLNTMFAHYGEPAILFLQTIKSTCNFYSVNKTTHPIVNHLNKKLETTINHLCYILGYLKSSWNKKWYNINNWLELRKNLYNFSGMVIYTYRILQRVFKSWKYNPGTMPYVHTLKLLGAHPACGFLSICIPYILGSEKSVLAHAVAYLWATQFYIDLAKNFIIF